MHAPCAIAAILVIHDNFIGQPGITLLRIDVIMAFSGFNKEQIGHGQCVHTQVCLVGRPVELSHAVLHVYLNIILILTPS